MKTIKNILSKIGNLSGAYLLGALALVFIVLAFISSNPMYLIATCFCVMPLTA